MEEKDNTDSPPTQENSNSNSTFQPENTIGLEGASKPSEDSISTEMEVINPIRSDEVLLLEYPGFEGPSGASSSRVQFGPHLPGEEKHSYKPWNYYSSKSNTGFVGLSNQGATCYMNSLLQTLFMTPEFRKALYKWEYNEDIEGPQEDSIPYQLQKLFGYLQLTTRSAVETKGLTKSFGWGMRDAFEQHDIQELNRVLFDALEKSFKGTELYNIINELYQGTMVDRILCKECGHAITRVDQFLDIPLVIRNISSVEEALEKFIEDETLDGDNKFFCEKCEKKCDVFKGFKFQEFPYLLTLQLKRFDIDFESENMERIKLNNKVSFPRYLDMSKFLFNTPNQSEESSTPTDQNSTISPTEDQSTNQPDAMEIEHPTIENPSEDVINVEFDPNSSKYEIQPESSDDPALSPSPFNSENIQANGESSGTTEIQLDYEDDDDDEEDPDEDEIDDEELNSINTENFNTIDELMKFLKFYKKNKKRGVVMNLSTAADNFLAYTRANSPSSSSSSLNFTHETSYSSSSSSDLYEPEDSDANIPKGNLIYELYSILIHSGSAHGGHYFAYIKSFQTRKWYKFNDSDVSLLKKGEIESCFGGGKNSWGSSTNAYMLVYRRVNKEKNITVVSDEDVTPHLRQLILEENRVFEQEKLIEKQKKDKINVNVFWEQKSKSIPTDRNETLASLIKSAYEEFELEKRDENSPIKLENTRLRAFDSHHKIPSDDYGNQTQKTLRELGINDHTTLLLETRDDGAEWPKWSKSESTIHIFAYNTEKQEHDPPFIFGFDRSITLREFKVELCKLLPGYSPDSIRVFEVTMNISELLGDHKKMYSDCRIITGDKIYVEPESKELSATGEFYSPTKEWFKRTKDTIVVKFNLPGSLEFTQSVSIDQKLTLRDFKAMIEPIIGHPSDEFKVKRANITSSEYKELDKSLYNLNINTNVVIELGTPLRRDQHVFKLIKYNAEASKFDNVCDIVVEEGMLIDQLIKNIAEKLDLDHTLVRLRDKIGHRVTKIFKRNMTLKDSIPCSYDGRELVFEIVKEYCEIKDDENLVLIARYSPKENKLSDNTEVIIKSDITLWEFQNVVKGLTDIPLENISLTKPYTTFSLATSDTKTLVWKKHVAEAEASQKLTEYRWYINDGDLFFYKDITEDPPMDDIKHSGDDSSGIPADFFKPVVVQRVRREEKALKIKTRFDAEEEKEREKKKNGESPVTIHKETNDKDENNSSPTIEISSPATN